MKYFFDTVETIGENLGFSQFGLGHCVWILSCIIVAGLVCVLYKRSSQKNRRIILITVSALIVADELFKIVGLVLYDNYLPKYLPLHLCSINIFVIAVHAITNSKTVGNFLYTICIPASVMPLFFPSWTELPFLNFMNIHSFTIHLLLALYPLMLVVGGDVRPKIKYVPGSLAILLVLAGVAFVANCLFDTNFMFLQSAEEGNPLYVFEQMFGNHLIGFAVLVPAIVAAMHIPWLIADKRKKQ